MRAIPRLLTAALALWWTLAAAAQASQVSPSADSPLTAEDVATLVGELGPEESRPAAQRVILALGHQVVPKLLEHLGHEDYAVRWELLKLLGALGDARALPALADVAVGDEEPRLRWRALEAMDSYPDRAPAVELLREHLESAEEPARWNAAVGLSWLGLDDGLSLLHEGVTSRDRWRRWEAVNALARVHDETTARVVGRLLMSPLVADREETVLTLGKIGSGEAFLLLLSALKDKAPGVRWRACMALGRLGRPEAILPLRALELREIDERVLQHAGKAILRLEALL